MAQHLRQRTEEDERLTVHVREQRRAGHIAPIAAKVQERQMRSLREPIHTSKFTEACTLGRILGLEGRLVKRW